MSDITFSEIKSRQGDYQQDVRKRDDSYRELDIDFEESHCRNYSRDHRGRHDGRATFSERHYQYRGNPATFDDRAIVSSREFYERSHQPHAEADLYKRDYEHKRYQDDSKNDYHDSHHCSQIPLYKDHIHKFTSNVRVVRTHEDKRLYRSTSGENEMKRHADFSTESSHKKQRSDESESDIFTRALVPLHKGAERWDALITMPIKINWFSSAFHQDYKPIDSERPYPSLCYDFSLWQELSGKEVEFYRCLACDKAYNNPQECQLHWMDVHENYRLRRKCPLCDILVSHLLTGVIYHLSTHAPGDIDRIGLKDQKCSMIKNDMFPLVREESPDYKPVRRRPPLLDKREIQTKIRSQFLDPQFKVMNLAYQVLNNGDTSYSKKIVDVMIIGGLKQKLAHREGVDLFDLDQVNGRRWVKSAKCTLTKEEEKKGKDLNPKVPVTKPARSAEEIKELQAMIKKKIEVNIVWCCMSHTHVILQQIFILFYL